MVILVLLKLMILLASNALTNVPNAIIAILVKKNAILQAYVQLSALEIDLLLIVVAPMASTKVRALQNLFAQPVIHHATLAMDQPRPIALHVLMENIK